jgi:glycosyltransferase involved in cell wall biosynthesis
MISIIIPAYNHERKISRCIESILDQSLKNFELLISDDCSADKTYDIAKSYENKDHRIKVFKQEKNLGPSGNTNFLTLKAKYDYLSIVASDDFLEKDKLERQLKFMSNENLDFTFTNVNVLNENISRTKATEKLRINTENLFNKNFDTNKYNITDQTIKFFFNNGNFICGPTLICKTKIAKNNLWNEKYLQLQDYANWIDWIGKGFKIGILKIKLYNYVLDTNLSSPVNKGIINLSSLERVKILERFLSYPYKLKLFIFDKNEENFEKINETNINFHICKKAILSDNEDLKIFGCLNILNYLNSENQHDIFGYIKNYYYLEEYLSFKNQLSEKVTLENFDEKKYAKFNKDIYKAYKNDYKKIKNHFLKFGRYEKRRQFK